MELSQKCWFCKQEISIGDSVSLPRTLDIGPSGFQSKPIVLEKTHLNLNDIRPMFMQGFLYGSGIAFV